MCSDAAPTPAAGVPAVAPRHVARFRDVTKVYDRRPGKFRWRPMLGLEERPVTPLVAVDHLDLDVAEGESIAIIGPNGAGKSTILKIVADVIRPSSGTVERVGTVGSMIELGVGFHPELTGRENAYCSLVMAGLAVPEIEAALPGIVEFAGVGDAIDTPVKRYSLGMRARLGFAVATHAPVSLLAVDEILAVGDREFQQRCLTRIRGMIAGGTSLLFVTHEMALVPSVCTRAIRLEHGRIVDDGPSPEVVERYQAASRSRRRTQHADAIRVLTFSAPSEIAPRGRLSMEAEVEVLAPVRDPALRLELTVPILAPDVVTVSSTTAVPALAVPGRYRISGTSGPVAAEGVRYRAALGAVDGLGRVVGDDARTDVVVNGGVIGAVPRFATEAFCTISAVAEAPAPHRSAPRGRVDDPVVRLEDVTKRYRVGRPRAELARAIPFLHPSASLVALDRLTLDIGRGEAVGVIGPNGAGKSTLLRVLAGLTAIDDGRAFVDARPVPMLGIGMGLHGDFTGEENIEVIGRLLGMSADDLAERKEHILDLAGIGEAVHVPVRQYSSGMTARLGLAISMFAPGELLLIDEVLAVGDEEFRQETFDAVARRRADGDTLVFVSHELQLIERFCDRVVWLRNGALVDDGDASEVLGRYGNTAWAAGVRDATAGVRLSPLEVEQRRVEIGASVHFAGTVVLDEPSPSARLEVAYRLAPEDRLAPMTTEQRLARTMFVSTLVPAGSTMGAAGRYRYEGWVERNDLVGDMDLVVSVVDERNADVLAETYVPITVGRATPEGFPMLVLDVDWTVVPVDDGSPS